MRMIEMMQALGAWLARRGPDTRKKKKKKKASYAAPKARTMPISTRCSIGALECRSTRNGPSKMTKSMAMFQVCDAKTNHVLPNKHRTPSIPGVHCDSNGRQRTARSTMKVAYPTQLTAIAPWHRRRSSGMTLTRVNWSRMDSLRKKWQNEYSWLTVTPICGH